VEGDTNERDLNGRTENANPENGHNNEPSVLIRGLVAGDFVLVKSSGKMHVFNLVKVTKNNKIVGQELKTVRGSKFTKFRPDKGVAILINISEILEKLDAPDIFSSRNQITYTFTSPINM